MDREERLEQLEMAAEREIPMDLIVSSTVLLEEEVVLGQPAMAEQEERERDMEPEAQVAARQSAATVERVGQDVLGS